MNIHNDTYQKVNVLSTPTLDEKGKIYSSSILIAEHSYDLTRRN